MLKLAQFLWVIFFLISLNGYSYALPMPNTGQDKCYNLTGQMTCPNCPNNKSLPFCGQDAEFSGLPRTYTKLGEGGKILPSNEPLAENDGEWIMTKDEITGLVWENKAIDVSIHNKNYKYTHEEAVNVFIQNLNKNDFGGYNDWRLPTVRELSSLANLGVDNRSNFKNPNNLDPTTNLSFFPNTVNSHYWTSTLKSGSSSMAWLVYFYNGLIHYDLKTKKQYVRAVRGDISQPQIIDNGNGTLTDTSSGLMWMKCTAGQVWDGTSCTAAETPLNWEDALAYAHGIEVAGFTDWRLPDRNELQSLVDYTASGPSIDALLSSETQSDFYWTSSTLAYNPIYSWLINFDDGDIGYFYKNEEFYVRPVRAGEKVSFGKLTVNIEPQAALDAGAQWRRTGTSCWLESGFQEENVPAEEQRIEFKNITGWLSPPWKSVKINKAQNTSITGVYSQLSAQGSLTIHIFDEQGNPVAEKWRRVGTSKWYISGEIEKDIPAGSYEVEFTHLSSKIRVTVP